MDIRKLREIGKKADAVGLDRQMRHSMRRDRAVLITPARAAIALIALGICLLALTLS